MDPEIDYSEETPPSSPLTRANEAYSPSDELEADMRLLQESEVTQRFGLDQTGLLDNSMDVDGPPADTTTTPKVPETDGSAAAPPPNPSTTPPTDACAPALATKRTLCDGRAHSSSTLPEATSATSAAAAAPATAAQTTPSTAQAPATEGRTEEKNKKGPTTRGSRGGEQNRQRRQQTKPELLARMSERTGSKPSAHQEPPRGRQPTRDTTHRRSPSPGPSRRRGPSPYRGRSPDRYRSYRAPSPRRRSPSPRRRSPSPAYRRRGRSRSPARRTSRYEDDERRQRTQPPTAPQSNWEDAEMQSAARNFTEGFMLNFTTMLRSQMLGSMQQATSTYAPLGGPSYSATTPAPAPQSPWGGPVNYQPAAPTYGHPTHQGQAQQHGWAPPPQQPAPSRSGYQAPAPTRGPSMADQGPQ
jgi:hypothetical protein